MSRHVSPVKQVRKRKDHVRGPIQEESPFNPDRMRKAVIAAEKSLESSEDELFHSEFSSRELPPGRVGGIPRVLIRKNRTTSQPLSEDSTRDSTVSLDSRGIPKNWEKLVAVNGKGCHLCRTAMLRTDKKKKCHCKKMVHRDCF